MNREIANSEGKKLNPNGDPRGSLGRIREPFEAGDLLYMLLLPDVGVRSNLTNLDRKYEYGHEYPLCLVHERLSIESAETMTPR